MQLAISQNPHVKEPQKLWEEFDRMQSTTPKTDELDEQGLLALKNKLQGSRGIKVK